LDSIAVGTRPVYNRVNRVMYRDAHLRPAICFWGVSKAANEEIREFVRRSDVQFNHKGESK